MHEAASQQDPLHAGVRGLVPAQPEEDTMTDRTPTKAGWYLATHIRQRDPEWAESETHVYVQEDCGELTVYDQLNGSDRLEAWTWGPHIDDALAERDRLAAE